MAILYIVIAALLVGVDQLSKVLVLKYLSGGTEVTVLPHVLQFRYVENTGAAFSMLSGNTILLSVLTGLILAGAVWLLAAGKVQERANRVAVLLMVAGGLGNLIDRLFRHYVVDFMEFTFIKFAVFNFADCCVTIGAAILILSTLLSFWKEYKKEKEQES